MAEPTKEVVAPEGGAVGDRTETYLGAVGGAAAAPAEQDLTKWITGVNRFRPTDTEEGGIARKSSLEMLSSGQWPCCPPKEKEESDEPSAEDEAESAKANADLDLTEFKVTAEEAAKSVNDAATKDERLKSTFKDPNYNKYTAHKEAGGCDLTTNIATGLTTEQYNAIYAIDGDNALSPPKETPWYVLLFLSMIGGFNNLLWAGSILCFIAYGIQTSEGNATPDNLALGFVLSGVVIVTGVFSFVQERQSSDVMKSFAKLVPKRCVVTRDGQTADGDAAKLVEGDVIDLKSGDSVPADIRVITCSGDFKVENSSLTGEPEPQKRAAEPEPELRAPLESKNIAFYTTSCVEGSCQGLVIRTGDRTVIGQIKTLVSKGKEEAEDSPIAKEIHHFIFLISSVAVILGVVFFIIAISIGYSFLTAIVFLIGIIIANVPEGLLVTVTVCLTLTALRMKSKAVLVKQLEAVETLGSTSCICSDKTGTLTQNKMTVAHVFYANKVAKCLKNEMKGCVVGNEDLKEVDDVEPGNKAFQELWTVASLVNTAEYNPTSDSGAATEENPNAELDLPFQERQALGNAGGATDIGILKFCDKVASENQGDYYDFALPNTVPGQTTGGFRAANPFAKTDSDDMKIPFNSSVKYAGSVHETKDKRNDDKYLFCMKGAPERIWTRCSHFLDDDGAVKPMTPEQQELIELANAQLGGVGERVIGFAQWFLDKETFPKGHTFASNEPFEGLTAAEPHLTFVGLIALIDPPRPAVPDAVLNCQSGGIQVIMVTGDHPGTAKAIAENIKIISGKGRCGEDLAAAAGRFGKGKEFAKFNQLPMTEQWEWHRKAPAQVVTGGDLADFSYTVGVTKNVKGKSTLVEEKRYYLDKIGGQRYIDIVLDHSEVVFARTSPAQKLEIVKAVQGEPNPHIVAVTGDGVNDSPALSAADIGVAMGIAGSDVSKDAADMILMDDDFSSIVNGVEEGRIVFDNLKKSIAYTLTSNIPEIAPFLLFVILNIPLPLSTIMILAIDLGTDMYPAISMAFEGAESDIMLRKPRNPKTDNLVGAKLLSYTYLQIGIIQACAGFFCYFVVMSDCGFSPRFLIGLREDWDDEDIESLTDTYGNEWTYDSRKVIEQAAQTSYFGSIVIVQWADLIICKTRVLSLFQQGMKNWPMNRALVFETALAAFVSYCPGIYQGLKTRPLSGTWWLPAIAFSVLILIYDEIRKLLIRRAREAVRVSGKDPLLPENTGFIERATYY